MEHQLKLCSSLGITFCPFTIKTHKVLKMVDFELLGRREKQKLHNQYVQQCILHISWTIDSHHLQTYFELSLNELLLIKDYLYQYDLSLHFGIFLQVPNLVYSCRPDSVQQA